jgi:hypothetical protein
MNNLSMRYTTTAVIAIALASMLMVVPTNIYAPKSTTSGVHFQGPAPTLNCPTGSDTCTVNSFTLAGLGSGTGTASLDITGTFDVTCTNPGGNIAPGQDTTATGTSGDVGFNTQNGKAIIGPLSATLEEPTTFPARTCPNSSWTPNAVEGTGTITSAVLTVDFEGTPILTCDLVQGCTLA